MRVRLKSKLIAILTSMAMVFSMVPFISGIAFADTEDGDEAAVSEATVSEEAVSEDVEAQAVSAQGYTEEDIQFSEDGVFEYVVNADGKSATIVYYFGDYATVAIPSKVDGYTVTEIKSTFALINDGGMHTETVFGDADGLMSVTIPATVKSIGDSAFSSCDELVSVKIPYGVTNIGSEAFTDCHSLSGVTIPNSVTNIGEMAFADSGLTSVTIPSSVRNVWEGAFQSCTNLKTVNIQAPLNYISDRTFEWCENLRTITIPKTVKGIGACAFKACFYLTTVYYGGYHKDWNAVTINKYDFEGEEGNGNSCLYGARIVWQKYANTLTASGKTVKIKAKSVKKKNKTYARSKFLTVSKNKGKLTFVKASGNKKITINKTTGKVTIKKKIKKGKYKVKVKVTAAGNADYKALTKTVTFTVKVK